SAAVESARPALGCAGPSANISTRTRTGETAIACGLGPGPRFSSCERTSLGATAATVETSFADSSLAPAQAPISRLGGVGSSVDVVVTVPVVEVIIDINIGGTAPIGAPAPTAAATAAPECSHRDPDTETDRAVAATAPADG